MQRLFATLALLASMTHAAAGEISLYTHVDFSGPQLTLRGTTHNLANLGFNDRTSSIIVRSGVWEVCEHKDFGGRCIVLAPGEYATMDRFNDAMSSAREVDRGRDVERRGRRDRYDDDQRRSPVELFAERHFGGEGILVAGDVRTLRSRNFNDRAGSLIIRNGEWEICEHDDFRGRCVVYGPGRYPVLDGLHGMASSVRRLR